MRDAECNHNNNDIQIINDIIREMPDDSAFNKLSEFFKAYADPGRLKIIQALSNNELCVCDIAEISKMSQSAVSHQLRYLKNIDILTCRREGKSIIYSLKDTHILHIYGEGLVHINEKKEEY